MLRPRSLAVTAEKESEVGSSWSQIYQIWKPFSGGRRGQNAVVAERGLDFIKFFTNTEPSSHLITSQALPRKSRSYIIDQS